MSDEKKAKKQNEGDRIAKVMAHAGLCSRREAERWIEAGRVSVNGKKLDSAACVVTPQDEVTVDGKPLAAPQTPRLFLHHKPAGIVTTHKDEKGRTTLFDKLPDEMPRVISIGRLDINTEGLILLTTDGEWARFMELPDTGWVRHYRVRAYGQTDQSRLDRLAKGVTIDGMRYGAITARLDKRSGDNCWIEIAIREGKNREVRRIMEHLGLQVNRLIRTAYGPFQLGKLPRGAVAEVAPKIIRDQLPKKLWSGKL